MMHRKYEIAFMFMQQITRSLLAAGVLLIIVGVLIFMYPVFLAILVSVALISIGLLCLALSLRFRKYSKFEIEM